MRHNTKVFLKNCSDATLLKFLQIASENAMCVCTVNMFTLDLKSNELHRKMFVVHTRAVLFLGIKRNF